MDVVGFEICFSVINSSETNGVLAILMHLIVNIAGKAVAALVILDPCVIHRYMIIGWS